MSNNTINHYEKFGLLVRAIFALFALYALFSFLYYWDPTRINFIRLKANSKYDFDKINPKLTDIDPAVLISLKSGSDLTLKRSQLQSLIWGAPGIPERIFPTKVQKNFHLSPTEPQYRPPSDDKISFIALYDAINLYKELPNLLGIDRITSSYDEEWKSYAGIFHPKVSNDRLVIYQNGFASTYHSQWRLIGDLIGSGFTVIAHNFRWYGVNHGEFNLKKMAQPLRGFIEPVIISINYLNQKRNFKSIDMIGLSAGGWLTALIAAIDSRISRSYPVAGVYPMYLREGNEFALPNIDSMIVSVVNYLDVYVLGSSGPGRGQMQIFNQFDRCCFRNTKGKLFEGAVSDAVRSIGLGSFRVLIDKTHARHKISRYAFNQILLDVNRND